MAHSERAQIQPIVFEPGFSDGLFPERCCNCTGTYDGKVWALYAVRVPICTTCRRRWNWIRGMVSGVPTAAALSALGWIILANRPPSPTPLDWILLATTTVGLGTAITLILVHLVGWTIFPARVVKYRHDPKFYVTFRNREYHQAAEESVRFWRQGR